MLKKLVRLILSMMHEDHYNDIFNSLYIHEKLPKTYGTRIKR